MGAFHVYVDGVAEDSKPSFFLAALMAARATQRHAYQARVKTPAGIVHAWYCGVYQGTVESGSAW